MMNSLISNTTQTTAVDARFSQSRPFSASFFEIDGEVALPDMRIEVQHYSWEKPWHEVTFKPPLCYLDLALIKRPPSIRASLKLGAAATAQTSVGDCVFVPAGSEFYSRIPGGNQRVLSCMFEPAMFEHYLDLQWTQRDMSACFDIRNSNIRATLQRLAEEVLAPGFASEFLVEVTMRSLVIELVRHFRGINNNVVDGAGSQLSAKQLRLITERVENLQDAAPKLNELAALCGVTSRHLTRAYKNTTGTTLGERIAGARIRQAKDLLSRRDVLIKTVAYDIGFKNPAAFSAAFRRATGWSPQQFRKEALGFID
ncbi:MAG: helix-turn-helix domain protein [Verrucomicrobiaceae bacterium]|nr:helix-turn-helix domain protein [Verrucomicrobiaceae bacterium]